MKYGSTIYSEQQISTCEIAGAVALCAIHDLRVNCFVFSGFPQILVENSEGGFKVTLSIIDEKMREASFFLEAEEAFRAARHLKSKQSGYDAAIFNRVQDALAMVVG